MAEAQSRGCNPCGDNCSFIIFLILILLLLGGYGF